MKPDIDHLYGHLRDYTEMVCQLPTVTSLLVESEPGIGKSYQITESIKSHCQGTHKIVSGYITPISLFEVLHQTREEGDVLFLDDVSGVVDRQEGLDLLKSALEAVDGERRVTWRSRASLNIDVKDKSFAFDGNIIFCFNDLPDNPHMQAVKSRALYYNFTLDHEEKMTVLREIAKVDKGRGLSYGERKQVAEWLTSHLTPASRGNLRYLGHALDMYKYAKNGSARRDWRELVAELIELDPERTAMEAALRKYPDSTEAACTWWTDKTGKSERTFWRRKAELE